MHQIASEANLGQKYLPTSNGFGGVILGETAMIWGTLVGPEGAFLAG